MNGVWDDFIGVHWTPKEFKEWHEQGKSEGNYPGWTLRDHVERIVDSVFDDDDWWWTDEDYRRFMKDAYKDEDREHIIDTLMESFEE